MEVILTKKKVITLAIVVIVLGTLLLIRSDRIKRECNNFAKVDNGFINPQGYEYCMAKYKLVF